MYAVKTAFTNSAQTKVGYGEKTMIAEMLSSIRLIGLLGCLCIVLSGCNDAERSVPAQQTVDPHNKLASAEFSVRWRVPQADQQPGTAQRGAISNSCADIGVEQVECVVYDDNNGTLASGIWPCSRGEGDPLRIAPGPDRRFVVLGRDADGDIIYHGISTATINAGEKTNLGPIDAYSFLPNALKAERITDTQIDISWTVVDERARIDGYQVYNMTDDATAYYNAKAFSDQGLMASTQYCYQVSAHDEFGHTSKPSVPLCSDTTNRISDTGQPNRPEVQGDDGVYSINLPSYTKMDMNGNLLPDDAIDWVMVRDNVTGLIWEVKTNTPGTRYASEAYSWNLAHAFINQLNDEQFGGYADWRVPSKMELFSLFYLEKPGMTIDSAYFPHGNVTVPVPSLNNNQKLYWTVETFVEGYDQAWGVSFSNYPVFPWPITERFLVRAVRGVPKSKHLVDNEDGTVTDKSTGLMWVKLDQLKAPPFFDAGEDKLVGLPWEEALAACVGLSFAGHDDWRMPNIKELLSLTATDRMNPSIDIAYFIDMPETMRPYDFWSSTTSVIIKQQDHNPEDYAYTVDFFYGGVSPASKTPDSNSTNYIRPVRDAKPD